MLVPELVELLLPNINILLDKNVLERYHVALSNQNQKQTSLSRSPSKLPKASPKPDSIFNAINAPLISEGIRLLQWMTFKVSAKSLNMTIFDDNATAGVNLTNLEVSANEIEDHVQQSAEISLSLEQLTSSFSQASTYSSINPLTMENLNATLTGSLTNRAVSLNFGVKASPTVNVDHPLLTKISEIAKSSYFTSTQDQTPEPLAHPLAQYPPPPPNMSFTGKKIKQIDLSLLLHNTTVSLRNGDETSLHLKVGVMRGSSQIIRIGDKRLPPFFLECRKIGLGLEAVKEQVRAAASTFSLDRYECVNTF